jgi:NADH-quinone oxidoreductase subunit J
MFILFSAMIIIFSVLTVTTRKILRAAVYLLFVLVSTSGLYFMLNYQFLAAVQLTVYAGGIVVLIIFSVLLTSHISQKFESAGWKKNAFSAIAALAGAALSIITILDYQFTASKEVAKEVDMTLIGKSLLSVDYNGYVLPFEVISILLLAAMIASIVVAKKAGPLKTQSPTLNK